MSKSMVVANVPDKASALTNMMYIADQDIGQYKFVIAGSYVFTLAIHPDINPGMIGMGNLHRKMLRVCVQDTMGFMFIESLDFLNIPDAVEICGDVRHFANNTVVSDLAEVAQVARTLTVKFHGQVFGYWQEVAFNHNDQNYKLVVKSVNASVVRECTVFNLNAV